MLGATVTNAGACVRLRVAVSQPEGPAASYTVATDKPSRVWVPLFDTVSVTGAGLAPPCTALNAIVAGLMLMTGPGETVAVTVSTYGLFEAPADVSVMNAVSWPGASRVLAGVRVSVLPATETFSQFTPPLPALYTTPWSATGASVPPPPLEMVTVWNVRSGPFS